MLSIAPDVYFRKYGEYNYVRDVALARDYIMNETSYDIMEFIREHQPCDGSELVSYLRTIYEITEDAEFEQDIREFTEQLLSDHILLSDEDTDENNEYLRGIIQQTCFETHQLFTVCMELTYRCNEKCIHCYVDTPSEQGVELRTSEVYGLIDQLKELGCMGVLLTGGEVTLRPDFMDIARYVKQAGMLVDIYTNGLMVSDAVVDELIELKPNSVSFSLYGGTPEIHDRVTTVPGSFEKSLRTIMMIKCAGIDTFIKSVLLKENADDYENLLKLGKRLGIPVKASISIMPTHKGKQADRFRLLDRDRYIKVLKLEEEYGVRDFSQDASKRGRYICASGLDSMAIDPIGNVHPCNAHPAVLGNVREQSLKEIWENSDILKAMREVRPQDVSEECAACEDYHYCSICVGSAIRENGSLSPCSDTCMIAQAYHCMYIQHGKEEL